MKEYINANIKYIRIIRLKHFINRVNSYISDQTVIVQRYLNDRDTLRRESCCT